MAKKEFKIRSFDDTELNAYSWDQNGAEAIVYIVHGHGEHLGRYEEAATYFNDNGISVAGVDLRGHGKSAGKKGFIRSIDNYFNDITSLLANFEPKSPNLKKFLFGQSMGGGLVLNYLINKKPDLSGAIVSSPWIELIAKPNLFQKISSLIGDRLFPFITDHTNLDSRLISSIPGEQERYANDPMIHDLMSGKLYGEINRAGQQSLLEGDKIQIPVLLSHGKDDEITSGAASDKFAALSDNFTLKFWEGARHEPHHDISKEAVLKSYVDFIKNNS